VRTGTRSCVLSIAVATAAVIGASSPIESRESQQPTTVVSGVVTDQLQGVVSDVQVSLVDAEGKSRAKTKSGNDGRYSLKAIPDGPYILHAMIMGFKTSREQMAVTGGTISRDISLKIGGIEETVRVRAATRYVNKPFVAGAEDPGGHCEESFEAGGPGGRVKSPIKIHHAWPQYPAAQKDAGLEGQVLVQAVLGADGVLTKMRVTTTHEEFARAAATALAQWRFTPMRLNCRPVETDATIRFVFVR
jgi:TonB family protein